ncbi:MAG TPA: DUF1800 family protein, partial [Cyclobacteriaceae bacterium]|nr:DUF1800 family protein [Cyclobacteriaceae bacterium]
MLNKVIHFQRRMGFGEPLGLQKTSEQSKVSFDSLVDHNAKEKAIHVVEKPELDPTQMRNSEESLKKVFQKSRQETLKLNYAWMEQMIKPEFSIREKMTFFWHDHFACRSRVAYLAQQQNNTIRKNALGSFADLLMAVSKDPAMIQFLNNQQNKKDSPNENFARE